MPGWTRRPRQRPWYRMCRRSFWASSDGTRSGQSELCARMPQSSPPGFRPGSERRMAGLSGGEPAAVLPCERLFQAKAHELPSPEGAMEAVFPSGALEEGIHDFRPLGPWPLPGTVSPKNGRVPGAWGCARCGRTAGDTSWAKAALRLSCLGGYPGCTYVGAGRHPLAVQQMLACSQAAACSPV